MTIDQIMHEYLSALKFIAADAGRDPQFSTNHLLSSLGQDFIESAVAITFLGAQGALRAAKRELRFIIESSVKICYVQQKSYSSSIEDKLAQFEKMLNSPSISIKKDLALAMMPADLQDQFGEEIGRLYGETSGYVHLTTRQISERVDAVNAGRTVGFESADEVSEVSLLVSRGYSASLGLLLHSVPSYVAGDWLVGADGSTIESYFLGSKFIAGMDGHFDYKHERQHQIQAVKAARTAKVAF